jgi:SAM-dependent methyltransferase
LNLRALDNRWDKYGVELSQKLAEVAREFANAEVFCGLIEEFSPNEQKFDVVTAHAVIEHVYDPADLLRRMISLTQPGGLIMLMTGDRESNAAKMLGPSWPLYISNDHVSFFSARSLRALARRLGLTVIHEEWRYMHLPKERQTLFRRTIEKTREILGFLDYPTNDIYHLYARSPA